MEAEMYHLHPAEPLMANTVTCMPRLRGGGSVRRRPRQHGAGGAPPAPTSSVSVIDRVRDVLLRLAMLSASSSSSPKHGARLHHHQQQTTAPGPPTRAASVRMSPSYSDSYPSDAVDDCIEFLKRSAAGSGGGAVQAAPEPVISSAP
uniref:Uncharacterized protein n=1 Tax=Avena sativa TaxID=4498 RepID=A0ACD5V372_AVESA